MFKPVKKSEINQISLTGVRAIIMMGLLIDSPRSLNEIREIFIKLNILEPVHSDDILRIDLNTLKAIGCEITRADAKTGHKYTLTKHPFALNITQEEIAVIKRAYKKVKRTADIELMLEFDGLFKKIAAYIYDNDIKETIYGLFAIKAYDSKLIKDLLDDCKCNRTLNLIYQTPQKTGNKKEISAQKLVFHNDKIYLYAFDFKKNKSIILNVKRILSVISRTAGNDNIKVEYYKVKFFLKNFGVLELEENEKIIENKDNGYIIEGQYYNTFLAAQRMLSFGANCTVLEPDDFREEIICKLKNMREVYNDETSA